MCVSRGKNSATTAHAAAVSPALWIGEGSKVPVIMAAAPTLGVPCVARSPGTCAAVPDVAVTSVTPRPAPPCRAAARPILIANRRGQA